MHNNTYSINLLSLKIYSCKLFLNCCGFNKLSNAILCHYTFRDNNTPYKTEQSFNSCISKRLQNLIHQNLKQSFENTNTHIKHIYFLFLYTNSHVDKLGIPVGSVRCWLMSFNFRLNGQTHSWERSVSWRDTAKDVTRFQAPRCHSFSMSRYSAS